MPEPLRNPLYPYLLSLGYYLGTIRWGPSLVQLACAVVADYHLLGILKHIYGRVSWVGLGLVFGNWYWASALVRTYFNSFETAVIVVGFYYWVVGARLGHTDKNDILNRLCATVGYVARPTSLVVWALLWPY